MEKKSGEVNLSRRQMLKGAAGTGLVLLLPVLADRASAAADQWTPVGAANLFPLNQPTRVQVTDGVFYVTRTGDASLTAVSAHCTHRGCVVGWNAPGNQFKCPCHGAAFALSGANLQGPHGQPAGSIAPLPPVPARQNAGQVEVNLAALGAS